MQTVDPNQVTEQQPQESEQNEGEFQGQQQSGTNYQTGSLYVGDLEPNVTESVLFEIFRKVGPVASIRVCRDSSTRRSLGYAYVNYHRVEDAERALDTLNYSPITGGRPCRIMWSQRDPSLRKNGAGNIYIKDLDLSITSQDLYDTFSQFGPILSCKVETEPNGQSKGFGYVHFETVEDATNAIEQINGMEIEGKKVSVMPFKTKTQRVGSSGQTPKFTNIYVKNLDASVDEKELERIFSECGKITSLMIMRHENEESKGFGFINFENFDQAQKAVDEMNGREVKGKTIYVARAQKRSERLQLLRRQFEERKLQLQESNLYIKNLDDQVDDEKLFQLFSPHGSIISAKVMRDENGASKGFGFVCFSTPEEAQKAVFELNGRMHCNKPLYVAPAQRKEVRIVQLQARYAHRQLSKNLPNNMPFQQQPFGFRGPPNQQFPFQQQQMYQNQQPRGWGQQQPPQQQPNNPGFVNYQRQPKKPQTNAPPRQEVTPQNNLSQMIEQIQSLPEEGRKRAIGDHLYLKIDQYFKSNPESGFNDAGKITGMLLESLDESELLHLAEDAKELVKRINEAVSVLQDHEKLMGNQN